MTGIEKFAPKTDDLFAIKLIFMNKSAQNVPI